MTDIIDLEGKKNVYYFERKINEIVA